MTRRHFLYGGVAAAASLSGLGSAWWDARQRGGDPVSPVSSAEAAESFWRLSFETPDGKMLPMSSFRGKRLLVNFWATWCPPCVEELPLLDYFYQENRDRNWQLLGLAVDQPGAVRTWLSTRPLHFPVGMAGLSGTGLSKALGNAAGSLPFSVVFDRSGEVLHRRVGKVPPEDLGVWAQLK
ncbi:MAG: TlpA family protein disulfide reductase [Pseudomonadota bacterium]|nr:TlpA family protein disulfide reductase [Pseudomonadota bacterium]